MAQALVLRNEHRLHRFGAVLDGALHSASIALQNDAHRCHAGRKVELLQCDVAVAKQNRIDVGALLSAGVKDLRTYTFLPYTALVNNSPGVAHDYPAQHRYHGVVLFGTDDRAAVDELFEHAAIIAVVEQQHTAVSAVHAYTVERTVPVIRMGARS